MKKWLRKNRIRLAAAGVWLGIWQLVSAVIDKDFLFASPASVLKALLAMGGTTEFWISILHSTAGIAVGFVVAVIGGILLAAFSCRLRLVQELVTFFMQMIKSIPVASFVILALLWVSSRRLPTIMSFLMVLPVIYFNVLKGIEAVDPKMLEMAEVFHIPWQRRIRYLYLPALTPYFISAASVGLGFCWKSGVAAEIIGLPEKTIGSRLYEAKLYLLTPELFAWTLVIVALSIIFEKLVMFLIRKGVELAVPKPAAVFKKEKEQQKTT